MKIKFVEVENFRRLKSTRIHFGKENTIFTGPNNSGKTTAMSALIKFLGKEDKISINDFTLSIYKDINKIGETWEREYKKDDIQINEDQIEETIQKIDELVPKLDIWLKVDEGEEMYVEELLPTLNWSVEENLGIRITLNIGNNLNELYSDYLQHRGDCKKSKKIEPEIELWPLNLVDFLRGNKEPNLYKYFTKAVYILDPQKLDRDDNILKNNNITEVQQTPRILAPLSMEVLKDLFRVDVIKAQRGFKDDEGDPLSGQLHRYYTNHLDMEESPSEADLRIRKIQQDTDLKINDGLELSFKPAISELNILGYPGFSDPELRITTTTNMSEQIKRNTRMTNKVHGDYDIPESYNGLGYQNLISMTFLMIEFRDGWMNRRKRHINLPSDRRPKLHLVLIEEPEAHLHVQVQEVFLKNAYKTLRKDVPSEYHTQLVISTHSSNIVNGSEFQDLRYFKKQKMDGEECPVSGVVNMHNVFGGDENNTKRFVKRYIRSSHCDLFFADGIILVEGKAESILLPHFISNSFQEVDSTYISILEVGGSHMYRLRSLIETLAIPCLIVTDIDSGEISGNHKGVQPIRDGKCTTNNMTIRLWLRELQGKTNEKGKAEYEALEEILDLPNEEKHPKHSITGELCKDIRVAYQTEICIKSKDGDIKYIPSTFEDALIAKNIRILNKIEKKDVFTDNNIASSLEFLKNIDEVEDKENFKKELYNIPGKINKANFSLDLFYLEELDKLEAPNYIEDGLKWLIERMEERYKEFNSCLEVESYA
jgi:predicted ATP-dependent endonuclease of OLD family